MATAIVLTCERDKRLAALFSKGIAKFWPELNVLWLVDDDKSTERKVPDDIRDVIRKVPYLRRVIDGPFLTDDEDIYILDTDCLFFDHPSEFTVGRYQGVFGYADDQAGLEIWADMGIGFDTMSPRFVGGMWSGPRSILADNQELAFEYIRRCVAKGFDSAAYPGVTMEQTLVAGLHRANVPDSPLPFNRYPIHQFTDDNAILHLGLLKHPAVIDRIIARYESRVKL